MRSPNTTAAGIRHKRNEKMKKIFLLIGGLLSTSAFVEAQDIIVLNNQTAEEIEARVIEVGPEYVKYKKWSNPDGPTINIAAADIFVIKYQNGEKQTFSRQGGGRTDKSQPVRRRQATKNAREPSASLIARPNAARIGVGMAKWTGIDSPTTRFSFSAGYSRSFRIGNDYVYLEPYAGIALKGMKYEEDLGDLYGTELSRSDTGTAWYAEIACPVRTCFHPKWSIGLGPYIGVGVAGKYKTEAGSASSPTSSDRDYFGDEGAGIKRFDLGLVIDARYSFSRYMVGVEFLPGLTALSENDSSVKNLALRFYVGYRF